MKIKTPAFDKISESLKSEEQKQSESESIEESLSFLKSGKGFSGKKKSHPAIIDPIDLLKSGQALSKTEVITDSISLLKSGKAFSRTLITEDQPLQPLQPTPEEPKSEILKKLSQAPRLSKIIKFYLKLKKIISGLVFRQLFSIRKEVNDKFDDLEHKISIIDLNSARFGVGSASTSGTGSGTGTSNVKNLDDLEDVIITTPTLGQVLYYDGTQWINYTLGATITFLRTPFKNKKTIMIKNITNIQVIQVWIESDTEHLLNTKKLNTTLLNKNNSLYVLDNTAIVAYDPSSQIIKITLDKKRSGYILLSNF